MRKLSKQSMRYLRKQIPAANKPKARWRATVRLYALEKDYTNSTLFLMCKYGKIHDKQLDLFMRDSPILKFIGRRSSMSTELFTWLA